MTGMGISLRLFFAEAQCTSITKKFYPIRAIRQECYKSLRPSGRLEMYFLYLPFNQSKYL
ncbi:MAG: hypothetical protein DWQ44_11170 [Bacteroidetes bacterium]|nr:MAG: hypothetical protein DWQ33_09290 [Bacteroidota bacterium]REK05183.1 MAG: hypothetical protein DWQ39_08300 [Bacteroidota bacterium]REK32588.1 MAG: hypothetical protein DWQ44_11170 [Bacteroidota bacterium]REK48965.1 MAG: hypothetical protein DWQ48_08790 [Bacteroidota bacterium]